LIPAAAVTEKCHIRRPAVNPGSVIKLHAAVIFALAIGTAAQSAAPNLDVVGVKLGMPVKTAVATMKANNPRLTLQEDTFQLEGFDQVVLSSIEASVSGEAGKDTEHFSLGITMPPGPQVVWGVRRIYTYAPQNMPSTALTMAALRKKYGQENIPVDPDLRNLTKAMIWVFDAQGKPVAPARAHSLYLACDAQLSNAFQTTAIRNELAGVRMPAECDSVVMISASVQSSSNVVPGSIVVGNLIVQVANGPAYRASIEATRKVVMAAVNGRQNKQKEEINKRGAPKI
jgi:hypothetical protein